MQYVLLDRRRTINVLEVKRKLYSVIVQKQYFHLKIIMTFGLLITKSKGVYDSWTGIPSMKFWVQAFFNFLEENIFQLSGTGPYHFSPEGYYSLDLWPNDIKRGHILHVTNLHTKYQYEVTGYMHSTVIEQKHSDFYVLEFYTYIYCISNFL